MMQTDRNKIQAGETPGDRIRIVINNGPWRTNKEFAKELDVFPGRVSRWLNNHNKPHRSMLNRIAKLVNIEENCLRSFVVNGTPIIWRDMRGWCSADQTNKKPDPRTGTIRERRKRAGWTQTNLANAASLSVSTIYKIENGYQSPHRNTLFLIEDALIRPLPKNHESADDVFEIVRLAHKLGAGRTLRVLREIAAESVDEGDTNGN